MDKYISYVNSKKNIRGFLIGILILAGLGMGISAAVVTNSKMNEIPAEEISSERFFSQNIFVYGYWTGEASIIRAYNLRTGDDRELTKLPLNVKHVKILSPEEIVYISSTNEDDYGSSLVRKNIVTQEESIIKEAADGFGIDDYVVSESGEYVSTWEVRKLDGQKVLYGGASRVYGINIETGQQDIIYDEIATIPVHYPRGVTNEGVVFFDTFLPNSGAGWAYGMSVSRIDGTEKRDIDSMRNGTYSTQPILSNDGAEMVFVGYDGSSGLGEAVVNGFRTALVHSNTLELLDTSSFERTVLSDASEKKIFLDFKYTKNGDILFNKIATNGDGYFLQRRSSLTEAQVMVDESEVILDVLTDGKIITAVSSTSDSVGGNLGQSYEQLFDKAYLSDVDGNKKIEINHIDTLIQYIDVVPISYFASVFDNEGSQGQKISSNLQLQLKVIYFKTELKKKREEQQSEIPSSGGELPTCDQLGIQKCSEFGSIFTNEFNDCKRKLIKVVGQDGVKLLCQDSPLYLYGDEGLAASIHVGTPISNENASYSPISGFNTILNRDDSFNVGGTIYQSLEYDFIPGIQTKMPKNGIIIEQNNLEEEIIRYSENLGLNEREIKDVLNYVQKNLDSQYIFISHFDHVVSHKILPLYFDPKPDNYYNIVMYFKEYDEKPSFSVQPPVFDSIKKRDGFTAVEVSYITE